MVNQANGENYEVVDALNTSVVHIPGVTWSVSGTYLPRSAQAPEPEKRIDAAGFAFTYEYKAAASSHFTLTIKGPATCAPSVDAQRALTRALATTIGRAGKWPAPGTTTVTLVSAFKQVKQYVVALRPGRRFALNFKSVCQAGRADDALWAAAMRALHESTHAALRLSGYQPSERSARERVAYGGEACLAMELKKAEGELSDYPAVTQRLHGRYLLVGEERPLADWCAIWTHHIESGTR
jgi:hypothetical protein